MTLEYMSKIPLIGGHVSAAGGFHEAVANAEQRGMTCIQIFGASPRQWYAKKPENQAIERYKAALKKSPVQEVYLHASYLANLASPNERLWLKSIQSLVEHLSIAEALSANGLVFHIG